MSIQAESVASEAALLTQAEMTAFQTQVAPCWSVASALTRGYTQVVTVELELDYDGKPVQDSLRLIGAGKDTRPAVREAYSAAKHAIIRCGAQGYKLPLEKFEQWKNIEITFDPERTPT